jgi:hypothetical protein
MKCIYDFLVIIYDPIIYYNKLDIMKCKYNFFITINYLNTFKYSKENLFKLIKWGLGIGDGDPIPNPQSPIPNPQSPIPKVNIYDKTVFFKYNILLTIKY